MTSQCDRLLKRLEVGPVDPMTALNVDRELIEVTNRFGEPCRVARYRLGAK